MPFERSGTVTHRLTPGLLAVLGLAAAVGTISSDMYLVSFAAIGEALGASPSAVQLTLSAFLIGACLGQLLMGFLSDRIGRIGGVVHEALGWRGVLGAVTVLSGMITTLVWTTVPESLPAPGRISRESGGVGRALCVYGRLLRAPRFLMFVLAFGLSFEMLLS